MPQHARSHGQAVRIVAVTKTHGPDAVQAAVDAGLGDVGENRVQEALPKMDAVSVPVRWHLIGHLQRNKVKSLPRFDLLHSLDSARLADAVHELGHASRRPVDALVQVSVVGEESKGGFAPGDLAVEAERMRSMDGLRVRGVMTMAPFDADDATLRRVFAGARAAATCCAAGTTRPSCRWACRATTSSRWKGATLVRLGTILSEHERHEPHDRQTFHLTPLDVRRYEFGKALRGYDPERVDQFRDQVAEELERLSRLNQDLDAKARGFHEQLRAFRERDKAINEALISAQQLRGEIREQADKEAQLIVREAKAEGERMVEDARAEIRRMEDQLASLERQRRAFLRRSYARRTPAVRDQRRRASAGGRPQRRARCVQRHARVAGIARQGMTTLSAAAPPARESAPNLHLFEAAEAAASVVRERFGARPDAAIILGTGLGRLASEIDAAAIIEYRDIPNFPLSTVESHAGRLLCGASAAKRSSRCRALPPLRGLSPSR